MASAEAGVWVSECRLIPSVAISLSTQIAPLQSVQYVSDPTHRTGSYRPHLCRSKVTDGFPKAAVPGTLDCRRDRGREQTVGFGVLAWKVALLGPVKLIIAYGDNQFDAYERITHIWSVVIAHAEPVEVWGLEPCGNLVFPSQSRRLAGTVAAPHPSGSGCGIFEVKRR